MDNTTPILIAWQPQTRRAQARVSFLDLIISDFYGDMNNRGNTPDYDPGDDQVTIDVIKEWVADDAQYGTAAEIPLYLPDYRDDFDDLVDEICGPHASLYTPVEQALIEFYGGRGSQANSVDDLYEEAREDAYAEVREQLRSDGEY